MITYGVTAGANTLTIFPKIWIEAYFRTVEAMIPQRTFCQNHFKIDLQLDITHVYIRFIKTNLKS